jgi:hypothetical protein
MRTQKLRLSEVKSMIRRIVKEEATGSTVDLVIVPPQSGDVTPEQLSKIMRSIRPAIQKDIDSNRYGKLTFNVIANDDALEFIEKDNEAFYDEQLPGASDADYVVMYKVKDVNNKLTAVLDFHYETFDGNIPDKISLL